jgi:hypothetical protein
MVNSGADEVFELPLSEDSEILSISNNKSSIPLMNHIEDNLKEVHSFFMDTPLPEQDKSINEEIKEKKSSKSMINNNDNNNKKILSSNSLNISQINEFSSSKINNIESPTISTSSPLTITSTTSSPGQNSPISENTLSPIVTTSSIPELPNGWVKCFSKRQNRDYWFQASSGKSLWLEPT